MQDIFDISNTNVIESNGFYYFFRALNNGDNSDIIQGITSSEGVITSIRPDNDRFQGVPRYTDESSISLQEVYDHIKIHNSKDTNCISLSTSASVVLDYGRESYSDQYILVRVPVNELENSLFNAGSYMLKEIDKVINDYISSHKVPVEVLDYIEQINNVETQNELNKINSNIYLDEITINSSPSLQTNIRYRVTDSRPLDYQSLTETQNLEKNKIAAKMHLLQKTGVLTHILPGVSNAFLMSTVGGAFSSAEYIHYKEIPGHNITRIPSSLMDIFASLEQLPEEFSKETEKIKLELLNSLQAGTLNISAFEQNSYSLPLSPSIERIYNLTQGKVSYDEAKKLYEDVFYLAKSKLRNKQVLDNLLSIYGNNSPYNSIFKYIEENTFGIEPKLINRQSGNGIKITNNINLYLQSKNKNLFDWINLLSPEELKLVLNNSNEVMKTIIDNMYENSPMDKETYYINAIIDAFDWEQLNIQELSFEAREDIISHIKEKNSIELYNVLHKQNFSDKEISTIILTCIIKDKRLIDYQPGEIFTTTELESFVGYYRVKGSNIKLKDYQGTALNKINETLSTHNFSTCVLPTGAGKSFVALSKMLENPNQKMLYLAPNEEILEQLKAYVVKYVYGKSISKSNDQILKEVFPNLTLATYSSLISTSRSNQLINSQYDFIVLDELHRTGAPKWYESLEKLLVNQEKAKVLGITATPERDIDGKDMSDEIAKLLGYTDEEVKNNEHISYYMDLFEAISLGYVVNPKVVQCEYTLEESGYIENILEKLSFIQDEEVRQRLLLKLDELRRRLDQSTGIDEILKQNIKQGGKYIVFIPSSGITEMFDTEAEREKFEKLTGEDKINYYIKKLKEYLKQSGLNCEYYSMLGEYSHSENERNLKSFESDAISPGKTKFMVVIDKLNEGLHISNIDGLVWFRALDENSKILFLQQLGRIIYSIDPNIDYPDEQRPIAIDLANNIFRIDLNKNRKKQNKKSDYDLLSIIIDWYKTHGNHIPSLNSVSKQESRYASILQRIKNKYQIYITNPEEIYKQSQLDINNIRRILLLGEEIDLWNITLETRLNQDVIVDEIETDLFNLKGVLKDLYELDNITTYLTTDIKSELYIEFLNNNPNYQIRNVDRNDNVFPGTNIKIRAFLARKENVEKIKNLFQQEKYLSSRYDVARKLFNSWLIRNNPEEKLVLYIEFLVNNPNYKIKSLDEENYLPGTDIKIGQLWATKKNVIRSLINSEEFQSSRYDGAKNMIENWFEKVQSRPPITRKIKTETRERMLATKKAKLYIEFLLQNPDYVIIVRDEVNCYPGTDVLIVDFWAKKNHRPLVQELLQSEEYSDPKYDPVRERINTWISLNAQKYDFESKFNYYIDFMVSNDTYMPVNSDYENNFPGTDIKIGAFWSNEENRKKILELLESEDYKDSKYDSVRARIGSWYEQNDKRLRTETKVKLFIEFLKYNPDYELKKSNNNPYYYPGTNIIIGYFWSTPLHQELVKDLLSQPEYSAEEYDSVKHRINKSIEKVRINKTDLFIELLNTGYIPESLDKKGIKFPGTDVLVANFWGSTQNKNLVIKALETDPKYQEGYDVAQNFIKSYLSRKRVITKSTQERIELFIELLNTTDYIPQNHDSSGTKFPGTDIEVKSFWKSLSLREIILEEFYSNQKYQQGYGRAKSKLDKYKHKKAIEISVEKKIELYIELLNTTDYQPTRQDYSGITFPGTEIEVKVFWQSHYEKIIDILFNDSKYTTGYEKAKEKVNKYLEASKTYMAVRNISEEEQCRLFIELLNTTDYYPSASSEENQKLTFPGTTVLIKSFWGNQDKRKMVIDLLTEDPKYKEGYEKTKEKIIKSLKRKESNLDPSIKAGLYIELLNTTDYEPVTVDTKTTYFPGSEIKIGSYLNYEPNLKRVLEELESNPKYQEDYEVAKNKMKLYLQDKSESLTQEEKIALFIELVNQGYIPTNAPSKDIKFPTTNCSVGGFWKFLATREKIEYELLHNPKYQNGYEIAKLIIGIKKYIVDNNLGNVEGVTYTKSKIMSLCETNEAARIIAVYNGWLQLESAKINFDDTSSFAEAKRQLLERKERKK